MEVNPTRMCELLVGLPEVNVIAVDDVAGQPIVVCMSRAGSIGSGALVAGCVPG